MTMSDYSRIDSITNTRYHSVLKDTAGFIKGIEIIIIVPVFHTLSVVFVVVILIIIVKIVLTF